MRWRVLILLAALAGLVYYFEAWRWGPGTRLIEQVGAEMPLPMPQIEAAPVYRWTDAAGRTHYGSEAPKGVRAELATRGTVNALNLPKPPPAPPQTQSAAPAGKTLQDQAMERAIEGATR